MRILLVSPFAPYRDGIAAYALQELRRLREAGHIVEVCSPVPSAARWHLPLGGPVGVSQLVAKAGNYDRVVLQFAPELAFGRCRSAGQRVAVWAGLAALARRRPLEIRIHEIEYEPLAQNPVERRAARLALAAAERVTVHTEAERDALHDGLRHQVDIEVIEHGRDFEPAIRCTREEARAQLGLPVSGFRFVSIGFLQRHKGFDLAVDAIGRLTGDVQLHVVGSARVDHPEIASYVAELRSSCARSANATLHEGYLSDVDFDRWLQAADVVVLPYREIWSSSVLERANLFGIQVVASDLPQLRGQAPPGTFFVDGADELAAVMDKLSSAAAASAAVDADGAVTGHDEPAAGSAPVPAAPTATPWVVDPVTPDRDDIQRQIVERARASAIDGGETGDASTDRRAVDAMMAIGTLERPEPTSARPGVAPVKRAIGRLIGWQVDPLADRLDELQRATTEAVARLEARGNAVESDGNEGGS